MMIDRFTLFTRAAVLSTAAILLTSFVATAQTVVPASPTGSPAETALLGTPALAPLVQRKYVWITTSDGTRRREFAVALSPTGLTVNSLHRGEQLIRGATRSVPFDQIVKVEKVTHRVGGFGFLGFLSGAGLGLAVALSSEHVDEGTYLMVALSAGIGAGGGAGIGAYLNARNRDADVIYDAKRRTTTTMSLAPILSKTRKGVAFSMTWR